jgi:hypothetical protein
MTTVYLHTLHDPLPTELLERGLKWNMIVRNVTLVKQHALQTQVIHKASLNGFRKRAGRITNVTPTPGHFRLVLASSGRSTNTTFA